MFWYFVDHEMLMLEPSRKVSGYVRGNINEPLMVSAGVVKIIPSSLGRM